MKRKVIVVVFVLILMFTGNAYASPEDEMELSGGSMGEDSIVLDDLHAQLSISSNRATWQVIANLTSASSVDYVTITQYVKKTTGETPFSFSNKVYPSGTRVSFTNSCTLTSYGTYYVYIVVHAYKNGSLIESRTTTTGRKTYNS